MRCVLNQFWLRDCLSARLCRCEKQKQKLMATISASRHYLTIPAPLNRKQNCNMKEHNLRFFSVCCILVTVIFRFSFLTSCATTSFIIYPLHSYSFGFVSVSFSVLTFFFAYFLLRNRNWYLRLCLLLFFFPQTVLLISVSEFVN